LLERYFQGIFLLLINSKLSRFTFLAPFRCTNAIIFSPCFRSGQPPEFLDPPIDPFYLCGDLEEFCFPSASTFFVRFCDLQGRSFVYCCLFHATRHPPPFVRLSFFISLSRKPPLISVQYRLVPRATILQTFSHRREKYPTNKLHALQVYHLFFPSSWVWSSFSFRPLSIVPSHRQGANGVSFAHFFFFPVFLHSTLPSLGSGNPGRVLTSRGGCLYFFTSRQTFWFSSPFQNLVPFFIGPTPPVSPPHDYALSLVLILHSRSNNFLAVLYWYLPPRVRAPIFFLDFFCSSLT